MFLFSAVLKWNFTSDCKKTTIPCSISPYYWLKKSMALHKGLNKMIVAPLRKITTTLSMQEHGGCLGLHQKSETTKK